MSQLLSCGLALVVSLQLAGILPAADEAKKAKPASKADLIPADAKAKLEESGLKVQTGGVALPAETELAKALREAAKRKKEMMLADRQVYGAQAELEDIKSTISELRKQHKNLSAQLAGVTDAVSSNRIVGRQIMQRRSAARSRSRTRKGRAPNAPID